MDDPEDPTTFTKQICVTCLQGLSPTELFRNILIDSNPGELEAGDVPCTECSGTPAHYMICTPS